MTHKPSAVTSQPLTVDGLLLLLGLNFSSLKFLVDYEKTCMKNKLHDILNDRSLNRFMRTGGDGFKLRVDGTEILFPCRSLLHTSILKST